MFKGGLTGGIGSGKSYVAKQFMSFGIPVYFADKEAKRLMIQDKSLKNQIKELLGQDSYHRNGRLNRAYVASKIFEDKKMLKGINKLVHPAVKADFTRWAEEQVAPYVLEESAIIFENKLHKYFDQVILVTADEDLRIDRVMKRDKSSRNQVLARMKQQLPDKKKIPLANFIIYNNEDQSLLKQVKAIHEALLKLAKPKQK